MKALHCLALLSFCALLSCGDGSRLPAATGGIVADGSDKPDDKTDISHCRGETPVGTTPYGKWVYRESDNKFDVKVTIDLQYNHSTWTKKCQQGFEVASASVIVPSSLNAREITIDEGSRADDQVGRTRCAIEVKAAVVPYQFKGPCMRLNFENTVRLMIPESLDKDSNPESF